MREFPTGTLPKFSVVAFPENWPTPGVEMTRRETKIRIRMRIQQAGLRGEPRELMSYALFCPYSTARAGGFEELLYFFRERDFEIGHERTSALALRDDGRVGQMIRAW